MITRPCRPIALLALLALTPLAAYGQQPTTVTGRVVGEGGAPVSAANVQMPALQIGAVTRADGTYTLQIPAGRVEAGQEVEMRVERIGFRTSSATLSIQPGEAVTQNFELLTDVLQLEGVVATGIGQVTTRERLGVTINSVSGAEINRVARPNIVQGLAARAPNVDVQSSSGEPGASAYIRIRGVNTIEGSGQPLFVVDGVPLDNTEIQGRTNDINAGLGGVSAPNRASDLNPNDIESVEILKGAAAAAIYGARAANGVVLVTTRRGQVGETRVSFTSTGTVDRVNQGVPLQRSFGQGVNGDFALSPFSWGSSLPGGTVTYNHFDEMFETGTMFEQDLSVSGGSDRTTYLLSVGRVDHNGTIVGPNNFYDRTTARLNASHGLLDNLTVTGNFNYAQTDGAYVQKGSNVSGLLLGALRTPPEFDNRQYLDPETGLHRSYQVPNPTTLASTRGYDNPFFVTNEHRNEREMGRFFGNVGLDFTPLEWLSLSYTLGNDYWSDEMLNALPPSSSDWAPGRMERGQFTFQQIDHNAIATGSRSFSADIGGSLTLGYNRNSRNFRQMLFDGFNFIAPDVFNINNTIDQVPDEFRSKIHSESFFGQAEVDLFNQIFLTAALRNDGFSTFGEGDQRHWFPKASAAWDFTETLGMERGANPILGFGKLRVAWGQAGNEPGVYQTITGFETADFLEGGWGPFVNPGTFGGRGGLYTGTLLGQEDLRPERTTEREIGLDLSLFRDLVGLELTYYNAETEDAIFLTPLSPSTGYTQQVQNAARIRNEGFEAQIDFRAFEGENFAWEVGGQWGRNRNRVLDLGEGREFVAMAGAFAGAPGAAVVGHPIGVLRGNDFYRCGVEGIPASVAQGCAGAPAGAIYIGEDGSPLLDPQVRVIADPHPDWTMGIRNNFTLFNAVSISGLIDIRQGGDVWNGTRGALYHFGTHADTERRGETSTYGDFTGSAVAGPGADTPMTFDQSWFTGLGSGFGPVASQFIEDGSFVKLREVAVSFEVPARFTQNIGMSGVNVRVAGRNLATWTDYTGIDPETNLAGTTNLRGIDYFNNPQTRSFVFTVGLTR